VNDKGSQFIDTVVCRNCQEPSSFVIISCKYLVCFFCFAASVNNMY